MPSFDVSRLSITATASAYLVATCGELLAWIGAALLSKTMNTRTCYIRPTANFIMDPVPSNRPFLQHKYNFDIELEVTSLDDSSCSMPAMHNLIQDVIGSKCFIQDFPARGRPAGYGGLEVSYDILLRSLQAKNASMVEGQTFIIGHEKAIKLVKHTDDVFMWHLLRPLANNCSCWLSCGSKDDLNQVYDNLQNLDLRDLEAGRHILGECINDITLLEGMN